MDILEIQHIQKYLPHRYPFLLIDRVMSYERYKSITAIKNVTINEPFFQGHFPGRPIMPGVLIIEAMAQAAALLGWLSEPEIKRDSYLYYLAGVDNVRFKRPVKPGDQLVMEVQFQKERRKLWKFRGTATVDGKFVASAELLTTVVESDP
jgi:3-hydroxyacyl-[acyl-carrier-protein] dehydratase